MYGSQFGHIKTILYHSLVISIVAVVWKGRSIIINCRDDNFFLTSAYSLFCLKNRNLHTGLTIRLLDSHKTKPMAPRTNFSNSDLSLNWPSEHTTKEACAGKRQTIPPLVKMIRSFRPTLPRRKVAFDKVVKVRKTLNISNYTQDEIRDTWYSHEDMLRICTENRATVALLNKNGGQLSENDQTTTTIRGMECRTKQGARRRMKNKILSRIMVLREQERQRNNDVGDDPECIYLVYYSIASKCQTEAVKLGLKDESTSREINKDLIQAIKSSNRRWPLLAVLHRS
jgi:hypothetical protein